MVKHRPLMYKNVKKLEILRSEITFLMDVYTVKVKNSSNKKKYKFKLEHIRWRAIANPHALEDILWYSIL